VQSSISTLSPRVRCRDSHHRHCDAHPRTMFARHGPFLDLSLTLSGNIWNSNQPDSMANNGVGFAQQYGYFEMSAQLPADPGTWPGFWMRPVNPRANNGEVDILEAYTQFQSTYCMTLHDWNNGGAGPQACGGLRPTAGTVPGGGITPGLPGGHTVSDGYHV
jgi:hypothetical protein